jgi:hypothetical protein
MILTLVALAAPVPAAVAGLVYHWETDPLSGAGVTGSIEFAPAVASLDSEDDVLAFSFTTPGTDDSDGWTYGSPFAFVALDNVVVGGEFLCFFSCTTEKTVKRAARSGEFILFNPVSHDDNTLLDWRAGYPVDPDTFENTSATHSEEGMGRWVRVGDGARVPEPSAIVLMLAGLGLVVVGRWVGARATARYSEQ